MEWRDRIAVDPETCFGKPRIRGTRIWVALVLDFLAAGQTIDDVLHSYPHVTRDDVLACLAYGAEASRENVIDLPAASA